MSTMDAGARQRSTKNRQQGGQQEGGSSDMMEHARDQASHLTSSLKDNPTLNQGKKQLLNAYNKVCDSCGQLNRQYPSMTIGLLVLTAFCIGMALPMTMNYLSPAARFRSEHAEAHMALDQVLGKYYDLKSKGEMMPDSLKGKVTDVLTGADDLKMKAAKKVAETYLGTKLASETASKAASKSASALGNSVLDSLLGAKDSIVDTATDLTNKVLHREQPKETGIKGKLHEAEDKIAELLHNAAEKIHA